jgi:hypothetical protein
MDGKSQKVDRDPIISSDTAARLAQYCPDLENWPRSWCYDDPDITPGERIVHYLKPFLLHLLEHQLATKTLRRHRDNIWLLGGEVIRHRYEEDKLMKLPVEKLIIDLIHEDGGPLIYPRITEPEQESFDATCRKLYRFLTRNDGSA